MIVVLETPTSSPNTRHQITLALSCTTSHLIYWWYIDDSLFLCRSGARLLQVGDEKLLRLAKECENSPFVAWSSAYHYVVHIPIIAVYTKYDLLVNQFFQDNPASAEARASDSFDHSVKVMQDEPPRLEIGPSIPCVNVSLEETSAKSLYIPLLQLFSTNATHITEIAHQPNRVYPWKVTTLWAWTSGSLGCGSAGRRLKSL